MKDNKKIIAVSCLVVYMMFLSILMFGDRIYLRNANKYELSNHVNLEPFVEIQRYINAIDTKTIPVESILANLLGNVVLFVPVVLLLMYISKVFRRCYVTIPFFVVVIVCVEYMQYLTRRGSCDIDDFILNMIGVIIAFLCGRFACVRRENVLK